MSELWTVKEAALYLKWHPKHLYKMAKEGKIASLRVGKRGVRFDPDVIKKVPRERASESMARSA